MAYIKKIWKDYPYTTTPILADDLNNIENGISDLKGKILWTNPNPSAEFSAQNITLSENIENYDMYMVVSRYNAPSTSNLNVEYFLTIDTEARITAKGVNSMRYRTISITGNIATIGDGLRWTLYNQPNVITETTACVPLYIIGIKLGIFD